MLVILSNVADVLASASFHSQTKNGSCSGCGKTLRLIHGYHGSRIAMNDAEAEVRREAGEEAEGALLAQRFTHLRCAMCCNSVLTRCHGCELEATSHPTLTP